MSKIDVQRLVREQLDTLRVNVKFGSVAYETEALKAIALWDMYEAPTLPGIVEAKREMSMLDMKHITGEADVVWLEDIDDADTEVDVA